MSERHFAFISYASQDRPVADALLVALEQRGLGCWIAPRNIDASTDYGEQILQGIRDASVVVLVFSGHSNNSKYCQREMERGVAYGRRIFPIRIDSSVPSGPMEFHLSVVQWLEAQGESDWGKVAEQLAKAFERTNTSAKTGAMPTASGIKPYQFGGKEYSNTEELATALSENWDAGVKNFGRGFVSDWVRVDLRNFDLASRLLDLQEEKDLTVEEKLSVALVEMNPKLPGMWRGNVVNREWAAREPEQFKALLQNRIRPRLEKQPGWPVELVNQLTEVKAAQLTPEYLAAMERIIITGDPQLKIGEWEVTPVTLVANPDKAMAVLESKLPILHQRHTSETWLAQAKERWARAKVLGEQRDWLWSWVCTGEPLLSRAGIELSPEWLASNPDQAVALLESSLPKFWVDLTDETWLAEAAERWTRTKEVLGAKWDWAWSWACTGELILSRDGIKLSPEWLAAIPKQAVALLESPLPKFWADLTGETWLTEAAEQWAEYWPQVEALGCGTAKERALPWVIGGTEQLTARTQELLGEHLGARNAALNMLLERGSWGTAECVVLCAAGENELITPDQKFEADAMRYLKEFEVEMDWKLALELVQANDWVAVRTLWQEVLANAEVCYQLKEHSKLKAVLEAERPEYLDVVAACAAYGPANEEHKAAQKAAERVAQEAAVRVAQEAAVRVAKERTLRIAKETLERIQQEENKKNKEANDIIFTGIWVIGALILFLFKSCGK